MVSSVSSNYVSAERASRVYATFDFMRQDELSCDYVTTGDTYVRNDDNYKNFLASVGNDKQSVLEKLSQGITDFGEYKAIYKTEKRHCFSSLGFSRDYEFNSIWYVRTDNAETYNYYDALATNWDMDKNKTLGDFLSDVRANGLSKDVNWDKFEKDADKYGAFDNGSLAALYASVKHRLQNDFSGDDYKEQMSRLDGIVDKRVNTIISELLAPIVKNLGSFGVSEDKVKDSVKDMFRRKVDEYSGYISSHADYAGIKSTENSWLERDYGYMTAALVNDVKRKGGLSANKAADLYAEKDLKALKSLSDIPADGDYWGFNVDEEQFGFKLGEIALKLNMRFDTLGVGEDMKSLKDDVLKNFLDKSVNGYKHNPDEPIYEYTDFKILPVDKKAVYNVIDRMLKTYATTKDGGHTLLDGAAFAYNTHMKKSADSAYATNLRYGKAKFNVFEKENGGKASIVTKDGIGNDYWQKFYNDNKQYSKDFNAQYRFGTNSDTMKLHLADFKKFANEVNNNSLNIDVCTMLLGSWYVGING